MFKFLHKDNPKELLGIDIGTRQIKIVELERDDKQKPILKNYAIIMTQDMNLREAVPSQIAQVIKQALDKAEIKTRETAMSLPAFSTFLAIMKIDNIPADDEEINSLIQIEAKKYVPVPIQEVSLGWTRLGKRILLIAVPKDIINQYGEIAKQAGLELKALEAETFSLARALASDTEEQTAIVDFGARSTNISLIEQGKVKTNRTLESQDVNQIQQIIGHDKKIILTGGRIPSGINALKNYQIGNPWKNIKYPIILEEKLKELSPAFGIAIGLALRDLNVKD